MASKIDAVCLALTAMWTAAPALSTVRVADGPQVNAESLPEWLFVGYDADDLDDTNDGAIAVQDWMAFQRTKVENGQIICAAVVVSGEPGIPAPRARALDILSDAEDVLRADPTIAGLVMKSWVSEIRFVPMITSAGAKARVVFSVNYEAEI